MILGFLLLFLTPEFHTKSNFSAAMEKTVNHSRLIFYVPLLLLSKFALFKTEGSWKIRSERGS